MDAFPRAEKKIQFGMKCIKYLLIIINVLYLIIAFLMISGATTLKVIFGEYYYAFWNAHTVDSLSSLWIATGVFLLAVSIFGIAAAVKESTMLTNIYGVVLCLIFILQMAAAITGFTLITQSGEIVWTSINNLMYSFDYNYVSREAMDWVQKTFECCGNEAPSDWNKFGQFWPSTTDYWKTTYPWDYISPTTPSTTTEGLPVNRMPQSCCTPGSGYFEKVCDFHFTQGCHAPLYAIVSQSVVMIGSSALIIGVVQILGITCAFLLARTIRRNKTHRDINRWGIHQSMGFDRPAYVDQPTNQETETDAIKHI